MSLSKLKIEDLTNLKFVSDPQISPDGSKIVFCVKRINESNNKYQSHLYMADVDMGGYVQFTHGNTQDSQPRWSPDGRKIAFLRKKNQEVQIWLMPISGGEAQSLTRLDEGLFDEIAWSPDGLKIAFTFRPTHPDWTLEAHKKREKRGESKPAREITRLHYRREGIGFLDCNQHLWVCDITTGEATQLTQGEWDDRNPTWSPDSRWIAFISNRSRNSDQAPYKEDIWRISPDGGEPEKLTSPNGYKWDLSWSPDGVNIAYIGYQSQEDSWFTRNSQLWVLSLSEVKARCLNADLDRISENVTLSDVRESGSQKPAWSRDGRYVFYIASDMGNCHLYRVDLIGNNQVLVNETIDISGFSLSPSGDTAALLAAKPTRPAEVYYLAFKPETSQIQLKQITRINNPLTENRQIATPEEIRINSFDNTSIQGWLLKPPDFDPSYKYPLVLYIHGGPAAQYGNTFFHEFQVLAAHGYVVLYTNPRGSLGREETFATCISGDWGDLDYKDLMAAVDYAARLAYVDPERMAVVGGSYGGFMTTWIIGNSDRFQCAISERGIANRHSAVGSNDYPPLPDGYWAGDPWENPEKLWQQSPLRLAGKIHTPLLIIHSEGDLRCPISQAEQLFSALKKLQREVVFLRYPAETGHGLSRNGPPDLRVDRLKRIVDWLDQHLKTQEDNQ